MKIAAIRERTKSESRAAITPDVAELYVKKGYRVFVERGIGAAAHFPDSAYEGAGATVSPVLLEVLADADIILKVQPTPLIDQFNEIDMAKEGAIIIGLIMPYLNAEYIGRAAAKRLSIIAMEFIPKMARTQTMDVLTSQNNLAGYRSVIEALYYFDRLLPVMMTSAGTIGPAKILVLGAGIAGMQAIATAKRFGAVVSAYDTRDGMREQVESLGAKFLCPNQPMSSHDKTIFISEAEKDFSTIQKKFLERVIDEFDIVIATAQIQENKNSFLVTRSMVAKMKPGSIIVDMGSSSAGNVEDSIEDKVVLKKGVKIILGTNLASRIASDSSTLYAKNLYNFLDYVTQDNKMNFNDESVREMTLTYEGNMINNKFKL